MLNESDEIVALARNNTDPFAGKLKMALIPTIGPYLLPRVMPKLRKALPQLSLMLYEYQTESLLRRLRDGEIDLGLMALPADQDGIESRVLYEEDFTVALPNDHPLVAKSTIKVQDLKGHTLLLLEDGHCLRDQALEVCSRVTSVNPRTFARPVSKRCVKWCRRTRYHIAARTRGGFAVRLPALPRIRRFTNPAPSRTVGAVWRKSSHPRLGHRAVCDRRGSGHGEQLIASV